MYTLDALFDFIIYINHDFPHLRCSNFHHHDKETGSIELDLDFEEITPENITVLVYSVYNGHAELQHNEKARLIIG